MAKIGNRWSGKIFSNCRIYWILGLNLSILSMQVSNFHTLKINSMDIYFNAMSGFIIANFKICPIMDHPLYWKRVFSPRDVYLEDYGALVYYVAVLSSSCFLPAYLMTSIRFTN